MLSLASFYIADPPPRSYSAAEVSTSGTVISSNYSGSGSADLSFLTRKQRKLRRICSFG
jgi:hypothetical protein